MGMISFESLMANLFAIFSAFLCGANALQVTIFAFGDDLWSHS